MSADNRMEFGVVVIGRNEGDRLKRCMESASASAATVYVDSGSTDGSVEWACDYGADVIALDPHLPFTAARARNAGFRRLRKISPDLLYVQFLDGDSELDKAWPQRAGSFFAAHPDVGVVCGRLFERHPERSVYNWLCDREWDRPAGEASTCGGNAMMRVTAFEAVGGYREDLIAGEEPELCLRLRAAGWRIFRLEDRMANHDAGITRFAQWWRRVLRSGYGYAQGAFLHRTSPDHHYVWESHRALLWGIWLPLACLVIGLMFSPWGWAAFLIFPVQVLRQTLRNSGPLRERALLALFQLLARVPESWGQLKFMRDRLLGRHGRLAGYK